MFDTLFDGTVGGLDKRFLLTDFVPSLVFVLITAVMIGPWDGRIAEIGTWQAHAGTVRVAEILAAIALSYGLGLLLSSLSGQIIALYEGYWPSPAGRLAARSFQARHAARLARLGAAAGHDDEAYRRIHHTYPLPTQPEQVMPTLLGNVLRNAELHSADRYGLDAVVVWPRLALILPDRTLAGLSALRADLELHLKIASLAGLFGVVAFVHALAVHCSVPAMLVELWGSALIAAANVRAAVAVARRLGTRLKAVFDTYRGLLLTQTGAKVDLGSTKEPRTWSRLGRLWYRAIPLDFDDQQVPDPALPTPAAVSGPQRLGARLMSRSERLLTRMPLSVWLVLVTAAASGVAALVITV